MRNTLVLAVMLFAGAVTINGQSNPKSRRVVTGSLDSTIVPIVNFCDLIQHPDHYHQKLVRVQAIEGFDMENTFLYDPVCSVVGTYVWAKSDCSYEQSCRKTLKLISQNMRRHKEYDISRAGVLVVGRFKGPNEKGYGHLNGYKFSFDILNTERVTPVPSKTPWPWEMKR